MNLPLGAAVAALAFAAGSATGPGASAQTTEPTNIVLTLPHIETRTSCDKGVEERSVTESVMATLPPGGYPTWSEPQLVKATHWVQTTTLPREESSRLACGQVPKLRAKIQRLQAQLAQQH